MTGRPPISHGVRPVLLAALVTLAPAVALPAAAAPAAAAPAAATGEVVVTWNRNAQLSIWDVAREQPQVQSRSFAMVHGAVHDAVNAIAGTPYQPYLVAPRATGTESVAAAVATATHRVLLSMYPQQQTALQERYDLFLATVPAGRSKRGGIAVGALAAAAMIESRRDDGAFGADTWVVGDQPGQWRPTPPAFASDTAWVGHVRPFVLPSASMFRTAGPPALTSPEYARDVNEVRAVGGRSSTVRTADQTQAALWWHDRHLTEWEIRRQLAGTRHLTAVAAARMFAMASIAEADAAIACFDEKAAWSRWRPVTAIQLADTDGNPDTAAEPDWLPLLVTPAHPDYTSGHTCRTAATMGALAAFFHRDTIAFSAYSADSGTTRSFTSFSQAVTEVIDARVWGGIHTRSADVAGATIGVGVTRYLLAHAFQPSR